jgi:hypothetical protein
LWQATVATARKGKLDQPLREPLIALLTHTLASGRDRSSKREICWRLRVPLHLEKSEGKPISRTMRALGWVLYRWGKGPQGRQVRVYGWRWREWNVSHVKIDLDT